MLPDIQDLDKEDVFSVKTGNVVTKIGFLVTGMGVLGYAFM
jgi:hypothetical protein